jgi:hypothetical protein
MTRVVQWNGEENFFSLLAKKLKSLLVYIMALENIVVAALHIG